MRNISVMLTERQVLDDSKTETRRRGARWAKPGMRLCAIRKGQGLKPGENIHRLCVLEIVAVRREPLNAIDKAGVVREGFPDMSPAEFVAFFREHMGGEPDQDVGVISFKRLPTPKGLTVAEFVARLDAEPPPPAHLDCPTCPAPGCGLPCGTSDECQRGHLRCGACGEEWEATEAELEKSKRADAAYKARRRAEEEAEREAAFVSGLPMPLREANRRILERLEARPAAPPAEQLDLLGGDA